MESQPSSNDDALQKLIQSARCHGDTKSVFGFLLLIERELLSEAKGHCLPMAQPEEKRAYNRQPCGLFSSYPE
jgi:hypothetical protein